MKSPNSSHVLCVLTLRYDSVEIISTVLGFTPFSGSESVTSVALSLHSYCSMRMGIVPTADNRTHKHDKCCRSRGRSDRLLTHSQCLLKAACCRELIACVRSELG